jgi:shikimate kinase
MRGTGKTTVGALLSDSLDLTFVDMDEQIVARAGMRVPEIVAQHGWEHFRDLESDVAATLGATSGTVIATGGGMVLRPQNVTALGANAVFVLLTAPINIIASRITGDTERSPLTTQPTLLAELEELWAQREPIYRRTADIIVDTHDKTPAVISKTIQHQLLARHER